MHAHFKNAVTDPLTDLFTRSELERCFASLSKGDKAGFFLIDIDHFKLINDCNGHARGDEVLVSFARFLEKKAGSGYVFRMGGDEFLIMVPGFAGRASRRLAHHINRSLSEHIFRGDPDLAITLSMGIAHLPGDGTTLPDILGCADDRLYRAKRSGRNQFCVTDPQEEHPSTIHEPERLIGREYTFRSMIEELNTALKGTMKTLLVSGERGIGKTFLCKIFLEYAAMRGVSPRRVALHDVPEWTGVIRKIVRGLFPGDREMKRYLRDGTVEYRDDLALLLDARGTRPPEEYRVHQGLVNLLETHARKEGPLVLFVDDIDRGGDHAARLLSSFSRVTSNAPVLLVLGFGCDTLGACNEFCARHCAEGTIASFVLKPFSKKDHRTLVKTFLGKTKLNNTLFTFIYERTAGNPLLTREVLAASIEQGVIGCENNEWVVRRRRDRIGLSRSIQMLLETRLESLSTQEQELLRWASVFGRTFEIRLLGRMTEMDEAAVAGLLRIPLSLGVVDDLGGGRFSFRIMYRDMFYERIQETERAILHKKIGQLLGRSADREHKRRSFHHFRNAGEHALATRVAVDLFRTLMAKGDARDAKPYIDFIMDRKMLKRANRVQLLPLAAKCYSGNGIHERAIELYRELAADSPPRRNQAKSAVACLYRKQGKYAQALDELLGINTRSPVLLCATLHEIAETLLQMGKLEQAERYARKALLLSQRARKKKQEADGYYTIAGIFWYRGEYELAEDFLNKALVIYRGLDREKEVALTMNRSGIVKWSSGKLEEAVESIEQAVVIFKQKAGVEEEHRAYTNLGILNEAMGQWKDAHEYYQRSLDMALFLNIIPLISRNYNNIGTLLLKEGRFDEALEYLRKALTLRGKSGELVDLGSSYHNMGVAYLYKGSYGKASHFLTRGRNIFEQEGAVGMLISNLNALFELHTFRREFGKANKVQERISRLIETNGTDLQQAQFFRVMARFHRLLGTIDESRRYARRSVELLDSPGELYEKGKALYELGLVLLEDESRNEAIRALRRARAVFKQLGAKKALERVEQSMIQRGVGIFERRRRGEAR